MHAAPWRRRGLRLGRHGARRPAEDGLAVRDHGRHSDPARARAAIEAAYLEIDRIESLISSWRDSSETTAINRAAGEHSVAVSRELFALIRRALKVSELTHGAFDITFATVGRLWDFKNRAPVLPASDRLDAAMDAVGFGYIVLNDADRSVYLARPDTRIGFGAIGKGYAANRAVAALKDNGIASGVVNAGGVCSRSAGERTGSRESSGWPTHDNRTAPWLVSD